MLKTDATREDVPLARNPTTLGSATTPLPTRRPAADGDLESRIFSTCAILFLVLAAFGFLGSGITLARAGRDLATSRIVFHGVAGFLWLSFFVVQTQLVLRKRVPLHRALGKVGVALFAFLVVATVNLLLTAPAAHPEIPLESVSSEVAPHLIDLFRDALFFGAAIAWWRRPFVHKRLMFFVTVGISSTGFVRIPVIFTGRQSPVFGILLGLAFAAVVFVHDWRRHEGWKRWFIPLLFVAMLGVTFTASAVLMPLVFSSEAWRAFLQGFA